MESFEVVGGAADGAIVPRPFAAGDLGNGLKLTMGRTSDYEVQNVRLEDGSTEIRRRNYARSDKINITGITDALNGANSETYAYSPANRLSTATGPWGSMSFAFVG